MVTLNQTLDAIMQLDVSSREMLLEILQKRQIKERRQEIARDGKLAQKAYKSGKISPVAAANVVRNLNAL